MSKVVIVFYLYCYRLSSSFVLHWLGVLYDCVGGLGIIEVACKFVFIRYVDAFVDRYCSL